jgi:nucleoside-diphosphate-sugar epimerase
VSDPAGGAVAITGANGYVGSTLRAAFATAGYRVIALQRSAPAQGEESGHIPYSLDGGPAAPLPRDVTAVIHCAYDLRLREPAEILRTNLGGTEKLVRSVGDIPVVLISSMSAYSGTQQIYGQTKLRCEALVSAQGGTSLRLGLVHGGADGGMINALRKAAALPMVAMLRPDSYQYAVHADDMARCVVATVGQAPPHRIVGVANPRQIPFSEIIRTLRAEATAKRLVGIPVSSALLYRALRTAEAVGIRSGFRADSLVGLMSPAPDVPHVDYWTERGIRLRDFAEGRPAVAGTTQ